MPSARTVVVIPAGPRDDVADTVDSVLTHLGPSRHVVVVDNTRGARPDDMASLVAEPDVTVVRPRIGGEGTLGALYGKVAEAMADVLEDWDFELLLRLDADALLIGPGLDDAALSVLDADQGIGLLGSYRTASDGSARAFAPARTTLKRDLSWRNRYRDPRLRAEVARLRRLARRHGFVDGEHVLGACCLLPRRAVEGLRDVGALDATALVSSSMCDDHLLSLCVRAAGLRIADFGRPGDPVAVRWKGLPASPEELLARGVAATHSVRSYGDLDEEAIRAAFRRARRT